MKIMKKITILILIISTAFVANAQQLPQFTQYMINDYVFNPAIAGIESNYQMKTNIRNQWVGVADAPRTTVLSIYGKYRESNVGLGGVVFSDQVGPTSRTGLSLSYAYHFSLTDKMKMSLALAGGFTQIKIDPNHLHFKQFEPQAQGGILSSSVPDATFAFYLYTKDWYVKWISTIILLLGIILTANNVYPHNLYVNAVALFGWIIVSIMWNDRALIVINVVGFTIYLNGIISYLVK